MKEIDRSSPKYTFVAKFEDDVFTRMTTFCANGEFDLKRGVAVARAAYESKTHNSKPPLIIAAKFVEPGYDDTVLKEYGAEELAEAVVIEVVATGLTVAAPKLGKPRVGNGDAASADKPKRSSPSIVKEDEPDESGPGAA
jgi:hypothetical protein